MYDNRFTPRLGRTHLSFRLGGKSIAYAYIRKNGCSTFKAALGYDDDIHIARIAKKHPWKPWRRHDATIFVWRDPQERLVSLYRNKILDRDTNSDLMAAYVRTMGEQPGSFDRFCDFARLNADPHCRPQADHLMPIRYTHAIPLKRLHQAMSGIVGEAAAEPFRHRHRQSAPTPVEVSDYARDVIRQHYARDYRMIRRIEAQG